MFFFAMFSYTTFLVALIIGFRKSVGQTCYHIIFYIMIIIIIIPIMIISTVIIIFLYY